MDGRAQGALEYLLILAAVLITVAGVVAVLYSSSSSLSRTVRGQVDNVLENEVLPGLAGLSPSGETPEAPAPFPVGEVPRFPAH